MVASITGLGAWEENRAGSPREGKGPHGQVHDQQPEVGAVAEGGQAGVVLVGGPVAVAQRRGLAEELHRPAGVAEALAGARPGALEPGEGGVTASQLEPLERLFTAVYAGVAYRPY
jgi:hypothetical protein